MKKLFKIVTVAGFTALSSVAAFAQDAVANSETDVAGEPMHQVLKDQFLAGGAEWMAPLLLCLVLGLSIAIERIITLNLSATNTKKLLKKVEDALEAGGVEAAKDVCRNTRGPVASIFYQGLLRYDDGLDVVEKSVVSYGSVQMGFPL
ncbi:MAG: MotA/TolQ/ExbB proton channel family protein, partial [Rikenellaceae bacterium]